MNQEPVAPPQPDKPAGPESTRPKVLITRPIQREVIDRIAIDCDVAVHPLDEAMPASQLREAVRDLDGLMASGVRVSQDVVDAALRLRVVSTIAVGYDNIDIVACNSRRILVTNTPDVLTEATADLTFALLLAAARRIVEGDRYVRAGSWSHWEWSYFWGSELHGKTLGLYGFGRIGQAVARRARGFGLRILYHSRHRAAETIERDFGAQLVDLKTLLRQSDFLSLHVPLTPETRHSLAAPELALMKPTALLINAGRGPILEEEALVQALRDGKLAGAGLDVFENEPKVHPALIAMDNVTLLPHIGSATTETRLGMALLAAENLLAALRGERPPNLVNPEAFA